MTTGRSTGPIVSGGPAPAPGTLNQLFFESAEKYRKPDALQYKVGGKYRSISHADVVARVRHAARGLRLSGVARGDRVAILSENRPEWATARLPLPEAGQ